MSANQRRRSTAAMKVIICAGLLSLGSAGVSADTLSSITTSTGYATPGLSRTSSAETMKSGRLAFNIMGSWYQQKLTIPLAPEEGAQIITGNGAFTFGVNDYFNVFGSVAAFGSRHYDNPKTFGLGTVTGGVLGALPIPSIKPLHLAGQLAILGGTSGNQINNNHADGYDYFETRTGYDFTGKLIQSLIFGKETRLFKLHFNEGLVTSLEKDKKMLLLLAVGAQGNISRIFAFGLELNSRSFADNLNFLTDPLWLTPSVHFKTPYYFNLQVGADVSLSEDRNGSPAIRSLEPARIFSGVSFSFDLLASKRREEARKKEEMEKSVVASQQKADSVTRKARELLTAVVQQREAERLRADSLAMKIAQDSIALAEARLKLEDERSRRSDAEKQLLSTGLLILDAVYFESGKTEISINSKPYLNIIAKMLIKYPKLKIEVAGHTDNAGKAQANLILSQARAESVRKYMAEVVPELWTMLTAQGYGPNQPKADNRTQEGRKINRRVELQVLNKSALGEYNP